MQYLELTCELIYCLSVLENGEIGVVVGVDGEGNDVCI